MIAPILLKRFVPVLLGLTFFAGANISALAQDQRPEVEVDISVLDDLGPPRSTQPVRLVKPEQERSRQVLTAPSEPPTPEPEQPFVPLKIVPPAGTVSHPPTDAIETPLPVPEQKAPASEKYHTPLTVKTAKVTAQVRKPEAKAQSVEKFPITEKVHTDSINPSAPETAPAPAPDIAAALSPAVPPPAVMPPANQSRAPKSPAVLKKKLVATTPHITSKPKKAETKSKPQKLATKIIPSRPKFQSAPAMPAVPAAPVASTTLSNDDLARSLSTPDRHKLAQDIDSKNAKAAPTLSTPTPKAAPKLEANPPVNPDIIHTPAENVNAPVEKTASLTEDKRSPRPPPSNPQEMNFFSVPCKAGVDDLDSKVTSVLQAQVLPLLKDHPSWKLQIQSFASPTDNEPISARKVSLSRALAVRSWLLDKGLEPRRMEVRALGLETDRDPLDRLDMVLIDPEAAGG
ncbi:MAG TPA: hypothetical protein VL625_10040 [Patescibacteria group bacterium]|nr:hypothetical protein [Patescibacteria group bacterium]